MNGRARAFLITELVKIKAKWTNSRGKLSAENLLDELIDGLRNPSGDPLETITKSESPTTPVNGLIGSEHETP